MKNGECIYMYTHMANKFYDFSIPIFKFKQFMNMDKKKDLLGIGWSE
jgi:hypothetical protein